MTRTRLDALLVERGLFESRSRAARAVASGTVLVGAPAVPAERPGQRVAADVPLEVAGDPGYASRGALKLEAALEAFAADPAGRECLDVGASTGGFTDLLLRRGAARVTALDVASGELHPRLRADRRVVALERVNARSLSAAVLPAAPELIVVDVSFISLAKVLPVVLACAASDFLCLALVKPQFELGPGRVGRGGVVRAGADRRAALAGVGEAVARLGFAVLGFAASGLPGPAGNRESFVAIAPAGHPGSVPDVAAAAAAAEGEA